MARTLYCRHENCGKPYDSVGGDQPHECPACGRSAHWATEPGRPLNRKHEKGPRVQYDLNLNDKRLLKSLRIMPE